MAELIRGATAGEAWHRSLALLATNDRQIFDLLVEIVDPTIVELDRLYIAALDDLLLSRGWQDTKSVANTIFPADLARTNKEPARDWTAARDPPLRAQRDLRMIPHTRSTACTIARGLTTFGLIHARVAVV